MRAPLVMFVVGLACATSKPPAGGGGAGPGPAAPADKTKIEKGDFKAMMARELPALQPRPLTFADGRLSGEVEAAAAPTTKREQGFWQIDVPLGTLSAITCFVYDDVIDGAGSLNTFVKAIREGDKDIKVQSIVPTDAGAVGESGYMMALLAYTKKVEAGLVGGQVMMFVRPDADAPLLCFHDEVGYRETFKRITLGLARGLKAKAPHPAPQYVEIQVARVGNVPVGFDRRTIEGDARGKRIDETVTCMLLPVSADQLNAEDHVNIEHSTAGRVVSLQSIESQAGEITTHLKLTRKGSGRDYEVTGKHSGKNISGAFKTKEKEGLASRMLVASRLRDGVATGKAKELKVEEYHGGLSPLSPIEVTYRRAAGKPGDVTFFLGTLEASGHLDARGMDDRFSLPMGSVVLLLERVLARGTP